MWNSLSSESADGIAGWLSSWWDFSSFGPDALIGVGTGLIVAMIVLGTERRLAKRARSLEVTNAEGAVLEKARSVLRHEFDWDPEFSNLLPDRAHLDRLIPVVKAVPTGQSLESFPGVHHAHRVVQLLDDVEASADAVDSAHAEHVSNRDFLAIPDAVAHNIGRLVASPYDPTWTWEWPEPGGWVRVDSPLKEAVEQDLKLRQFMEEYARNRRLFEAHREAFLFADGTARAEEWAALLAMTKNAPRFILTKWYRRARFNTEVQHIKAKAEIDASAIISAIDPMAY